MEDQAQSGLQRWLTPGILISGLIVGLVAFCALTFNRYGFTTDEYNGLIRARNILDFFASGGQNTRLTELKPENFYGAMADVVALWLQRSIPGLGLDSRHLVSGLFGIAGVFYTYRLGEYLGGRWVGVAAAGFLAFTPMWLGYSYLNLKDIPFGTALVAASYFGVRLMGEVRRPGWPTMLGLAIWCGALGTTKLTGILLLGFSVLVLLGPWLIQNGSLPLKTLWNRTLICGGLCIAGIVAFSIPFWPQLYLFPPAQVVKAVLQFLNYDPWHGSVLLNGEFFDQDHVPKHYLVTYLLITMPLLPLALYLLSIPATIRDRRFAMLGAIVLPLAFIAIQWITDAQVYNGFRQFLFIVPFICIGAGYGLVAIGRIGGSAIARFGAIAAFAIFAVWSGATMATLFPYQYSAYNSLVGGAAGAENRFYIDVWRSAEREALALINAQLPEGSEKVRVFMCGSQLNFDLYPRMRAARTTQDPVDYYIRLPRCALSNPEGYELIGEVRRAGILFAAVLRPKPSGAS